MNLIFRCEQCGVERPCIVTMILTRNRYTMPVQCIQSGKAEWKLLS
jgi:hypothetical protein